MLAPICYAPTAGVTLTVTPTPAGFSENTASNAGTSAGTVTASASGGTGPYTYAWTVDSSFGAISPASASSAATAFSYTGLDNLGDGADGNFRCTATDSLGNTGYMIVYVSITRNA
jgi:hypothetical protein